MPALGRLKSARVIASTCSFPGARSENLAKAVNPASSADSGRLPGNWAWTRRSTGLTIIEAALSQSSRREALKLDHHQSATHNFAARPATASSSQARVMVMRE